MNKNKVDSIETGCRLLIRFSELIGRLAVTTLYFYFQNFPKKVPSSPKLAGG